VLSYVIPSAMLEDLQNDQEPIAAFEFFGDTFILSPELEERNGGLVSER
jgi:hypothetical protein